MTSSVEPNTAAPEVPGDLIAALEAMCSPVILAHVIPDADALGSMLAVALSYADGKGCLSTGSRTHTGSRRVDRTQVCCPSCNASSMVQG